MPAIHVDQSQITVANVAIEDTDGSHVDTEAFIIPVVIPLSEMGTYLEGRLAAPARPSVKQEKTIADGDRGAEAQVSREQKRETKPKQGERQEQETAEEETEKAPQAN